MPSASIKSGTLFQVYLKEINSVYESMKQDIESTVKRMELLGMSKSAIIARLNADLEEGAGAFQGLGRASRAFTDLINTSSQIETNEAMKDLADNFTWDLDPTVAEHCGTCLVNADKPPMTWDEWEAIGIPGSGNTDCGLYCKCTLNPFKGTEE